MKYVIQFGIIAAISFAGEMLYILLPLPVPASVYGLILLFLLLTFKIVKLEQVEDLANFFLSIMPLLFISPSVSLITSMDILKGNVLAIILMTFLSTIMVTVVTGTVSQMVIRFTKRNSSSENGGKENE